MCIFAGISLGGISCDSDFKEVLPHIVLPINQYGPCRSSSTSLPLNEDSQSSCSEVLPTQHFSTLRMLPWESHMNWLTTDVKPCALMKDLKNSFSYGEALILNWAGAMAPRTLGILQNSLMTAAFWILASAVRGKEMNTSDIPAMTPDAELATLVRLACRHEPTFCTTSGLNAPCAK